jgi:hypothetical protein
MPVDDNWEDELEDDEDDYDDDDDFNPDDDDEPDWDEEPLEDGCGSDWEDD